MDGRCIEPSFCGGPDGLQVQMAQVRLERSYHGSPETLGILGVPPWPTSDSKQNRQLRPEKTAKVDGLSQVQYRIGVIDALVPRRGVSAQTIP
ncbi:hypothetical protein FHG71_02380 [Rubellimicrobium roseum]|uniref:Uncharacterized protein n=1 Tax=Rubellimicrobium roseum TaxID=687525 RepID=A0A5C4NRG8_9RHOB|nr:hypothetical protein FHG71_02380 [Rubellimicrobium roseum]